MPPVPAEANNTNVAGPPMRPRHRESKRARYRDQDEVGWIRPVEVRPGVAPKRTIRSPSAWRPVRGLPGVQSDARRRRRGLPQRAAGLTDRLWQAISRFGNAAVPPPAVFIRPRGCVASNAGRVPRPRDLRRHRRRHCSGRLRPPLRGDRSRAERRPRGSLRTDPRSRPPFGACHTLHALRAAPARLHAHESAFH